MLIAFATAWYDNCLPLYEMAKQGITLQQFLDEILALDMDLPGSGSFKDFHRIAASVDQPRSRCLNNLCSAWTTSAIRALRSTILPRCTNKLMCDNKISVAIQERIMRYHWSMLSFGSLYTLLLLGVIVARFVMNKPIPRHASMAIIAILLLWVLCASRVACAVWKTARSRSAV